jgi:hypothetical protein
MRTLVVAVALLGLVVGAGTVSAEIGATDAVPAATLLLPYFEVDLNNPNGSTTLFSINNASATAILAQVTFWTNESIPTFGFSVYLTGYDVQTINLRDIFNGLLPITASDGQDPKDTISPQGPFSQDINFASCNGLLPYSDPDPTLAQKIQHIRLAHTGQGSPIFGGRCSGANYGDQVARGFVTVDTVTQCSLEFPNSPAYFGGGIASFQNVLWGDVFYVNSGQNFAQGDTLVHIEACTPGNGYIGYVGKGTASVANTCPFAPGDYTFYGRFVSGLGTDQRESLATTFATRFINGGTFSGGTDLLVWRDPKTTVGAPGAANGPHTCGGKVTWFPLNFADAVAFDEQENAFNACFLEDNVPPAIGGTQPCFPLATQRIKTGGGNIISADLGLPFNFGWLYLNLNTTVAGGLFNPTAQAWVSTTMSADGRFSVGFSAIRLDQANDTFQSATPGGQILLAP